ncbi:MAG: hypothetical protein RI911_35 [Candidatus Parcubacteria bacterium]|jgi:hypothetical protein
MKKIFFVLLIPLLLTQTVHAQTVSDSCMRITALMQRGDTDAKKEGQVTLLQLFLVQHFKLDASRYLTGVYDKKTEDLMKRLQRNAGYPAVGNFGPRTREYLRGLCLQYNPALNGLSQNKLQTQQQNNQEANMSPDQAAKRQSMRSDLQTVIGGSLFAGLLINHYNHYQVVPIHTAPTLLNDVIPQLVRRLIEKEKPGTPSEEIEKGIQEMQKMVGTLIYISDTSGKSFCVGLTLAGVTAQDIEKEYKVKLEDYRCTLAQTLGSHKLVIGVSEQKLKDAIAQVEEAKKKAAIARQVQDMRTMQVALELAYDGQGKYPVRTVPTSTSTLTELASYISSYTKIDIQYVTDAEGKKYCLGKTISGELPAGTQSSCTNGLSLPPTVNYVVQP